MEMLQGVWKQHLRPRAVVGCGVKIFLPSPPNYVTRSPGDRGVQIRGGSKSAVTPAKQMTSEVPEWQKKRAERPAPIHKFITSLQATHSKQAISRIWQARIQRLRLRASSFHVTKRPKGVTHHGPFSKTFKRSL